MASQASQGCERCIQTNIIHKRWNDQKGKIYPEITGDPAPPGHWGALIVLLHLAGNELALNSGHNISNIAVYWILCFSLLSWK